MFKLTDLIQWKLAETKIYLDTDVNLFDLEAQLLLRGQFNEFDTLKDLRRPELITLANGWPGPRTRYGVEDIIEDIEIRKPKRKMIVEIKKSKTYINRNEAELYVLEEKDGAWSRVPSAMPGFLVANNKTERTLNDEIKRTVEYLSKKQLPDLFEKEFIQEKYSLANFNIGRTYHENGKNIAEIDIDIQKDIVTIHPSVHDYWKKEIMPLILDEKTAPANKRLALICFLRDISNTYENVEDINLKKVKNTVHILNDMLKMAIKEPEKYGMKRITSYTEIDPVKKIYANGLIEKIAANPHTIDALYDHEITLKFRKGEPFRVRVKTEIEYK